MSELTYEKILELFAESSRKFEESRLQMAESDRRFEETRLQMIESDRKSEEIRLQRVEETRLQAAESDKKIDKINRELSKKLAEFGDTLGKFAEEQVRADILNRFANWGIPVHSITNHFEQRDANNNFAYEIDILIYNSKYIVAIEVKNTLKKDDIDLHLERMKKIQEIPFPDSRGKIILAAVAGMIVGNGVDKYAEDNGLFVIKPNGETIKIANKKTFKPKEWLVN